MLSVYSRHYPPCPSGDLNYKRCRCPKWINGRLGSDGPFIRRRAKTRSWEKAEDFKRKLEDEYEAKQKGLEEATRPELAVLTSKDAVARFLKSKRNENLAYSTLDKLTTTFEKQFLGWANSTRFTHLTKVTTADLEEPTSIPNGNRWLKITTLAWLATSSDSALSLAKYTPLRQSPSQLSYY